jgi:hypothetical protein
MLRSDLMFILGIELGAPFDSYDHVVDTSASAPLSLPKPLSPEASSFASCSDSSCMQSPIASKPKPSVSKLESYEFLGYFD